MGDFSQTYTIEVSNLADKLIYNIYITSENDWPTYTRILDDQYVAQVNFKTLKIRSKSGEKGEGRRDRDVCLRDSNVMLRGLRLRGLRFILRDRF